MQMVEISCGKPRSKAGSSSPGWKTPRSPPSAALGHLLNALATLAKVSSCTGDVLKSSSTAWNALKSIEIDENLKG